MLPSLRHRSYLLILHGKLPHNRQASMTSPRKWVALGWKASTFVRTRVLEWRPSSCPLAVLPLCTAFFPGALPQSQEEGHLVAQRQVAIQEKKAVFLVLLCKSTQCDTKWPGRSHAHPWAKGVPPWAPCWGRGDRTGTTTVSFYQTTALRHRHTMCDEDGVRKKNQKTEEKSF